MPGRSFVSQPPWSLNEHKSRTAGGGTMHEGFFDEYWNLAQCVMWVMSRDGNFVGALRSELSGKPPRDAAFHIFATHKQGPSALGFNQAAAELVAALESGLGPAFQEGPIDIDPRKWAHLGIFFDKDMRPYVGTRLPAGHPVYADVRLRCADVIARWSGRKVGHHSIPK